MDDLWFSGQLKAIRRIKLRTAILWFVIGLFLGTGFGQWWRMVQVEPAKQAYIQKLNDRIKYYENNWTPIKMKEVKSIKGAERRK
jgi:hypothetical protein